MDWDTCNHKKLNQFTTEARRWQSGDKETKPKAAKGQRSQPNKRKKKAKK